MTAMAGLCLFDTREAHSFVWISILISVDHEMLLLDDSPAAQTRTFVRSEPQIVIC